MPNPQPNQPEILMPDTMALVVGVRAAYGIETSGEMVQHTLSRMAEILRQTDTVPPMVCHARNTGKRLGFEAKNFPAFDVLELFAFVRPAIFCLPTPMGLAQALGVPLPTGHEDEAMTLMRAGEALLRDLVNLPSQQDSTRKTMIGLAHAMNAGRWLWAPSVLAALGERWDEAPHTQSSRRAFRVWDRLPDWEERGFEAKSGDAPVSPIEAKNRLNDMLASQKSENRPGQQQFAAGVASAFDPCDTPGQPKFVLAEAGTGVGKTLGYVAPASVWADKNDGVVWLSTFTRNLQRQLDNELDRLYPDPVEKKCRVVVRKGRENYFCLLNFEESLGRMDTRPGGAIALGLVARWVGATRDGDMVGGDFPAWLPEMLGRGLVRELTDTKGECTYSACTHYGKCFIEHSKRRAKRAKLVIANHALVMVQAAMGANGGDGDLPTRYVFDEGHHIFNAADSAFAAHLSGLETSDLRRWILGMEDGISRRTRSRGLKKRLEELAASDDKIAHLVDDVCRAALVLPSQGWQSRVGEEKRDAENNAFHDFAKGPTESLLAHIRQQTYARDKDFGRAGYSLECSTDHPIQGLLVAAKGLGKALESLEHPLTGLVKCLLQKLADEGEDLDTNERNRIDGMAGSITRRALLPVRAWISMLKSLQEGAPEDFVDWFNVERLSGRDVDVGLYRHWVDPTKPFADAMSETAEGVLVTSATLRDDGDWASANARTGAVHMASPIGYVAQPSPFDYANATRIFVVTDVNKGAVDQVVGAYRALFLAANGGALGLFTAISRLRAVHHRLAPKLDERGLSLYAQHIDGLDVGTLVDIFRAEQDSCLLGTDAVRDGVDVPGRSLRLIVFDRVPWPRPDMLTRARRAYFGGRAYDEMLARLKLKQAYGRLLRKADDRGVFVMLDGALPTRLCSAFPPDVEIHRLGLKDVVNQVQFFLDETKKI